MSLCNLYGVKLNAIDHPSPTRLGFSHNPQQLYSIAASLVSMRKLHSIDSHVRMVYTLPMKNNTFKKLSPDSLIATAGCGGFSLLSLLILAVFGFIAVFLADDMVTRLVGPVRDDTWQNLPWLLKAIVAFMLGAPIVTLWFIVFVLSLIFGVPLFN